MKIRNALLTVKATQSRNSSPQSQQGAAPLEFCGLFLRFSLESLLCFAAIFTREDGMLAISQLSVRSS